MSFLFEVPANLQSQFLSGEVVRFGSLLKDSGTGRIVAHLQETGATQQALSAVSGGPFSPISAASSIAANAQLVQVTAMLQVLGALQVATLGVAAAGLGVSAVGFKLVNSKLNKISESLGELLEEIRTGFGGLQSARLRDWEAEFNGVLARADLLYSQSTIGSEWLGIGNDLLALGERYRVEQRFLLESDSVSPLVFDHLLETRTLINASAMKAMMLSGDLSRSQALGEMISKRYDDDFDQLSPTFLARKVAPNYAANENHRGVLPIEAQDWAVERAGFIRDLQESASTAPFLAEALMRRRIDSGEYVYAAEAEREEPLVLLTR